MGAVPVVISIVIPTLDAARELERLLGDLATRRLAVSGEILVVDGGSADSLPAQGEAQGQEEAQAQEDSWPVRFLSSPRGRGTQLARGAAEARGEWLLFLHADSRPGERFAATIEQFVASGVAGAGYFRLGFDSPAWQARLLEACVRWRCRLLALPYGDQGLLVSRQLYQACGGFRPIPLMEDVDLVRRIGRRRLYALNETLLTSASRYQRGWVRRVVRNLCCLSLWFLGMSPHRLERFYRGRGGKSRSPDTQK